MALKFGLQHIDSESVTRAREEAESFRGYSGPTPPPDVYHVKLTKVWYSKTKNGKDMLKALFVINEEGDKATYNRASVFYNMLIPQDPSEKAFAIQVSKIDEFMIGVSKGKYNFDDFVAAARAGKIINGKTEKAGDPIMSIGKLKFTGEQELDLKTDLRQYNGKEYVDVAWIMKPENATSAPTEDLDDDLDAGDFDSDDDGEDFQFDDGDLDD